MVAAALAFVASVSSLVFDWWQRPAAIAGIVIPVVIFLFWAPWAVAYDLVRSELDARAIRVNVSKLPEVPRSGDGQTWFVVRLNIERNAGTQAVPLRVLVTNIEGQTPGPEPPFSLKWRGVSGWDHVLLPGTSEIVDVCDMHTNRRVYFWVAPQSGEAEDHASNLAPGCNELRVTIEVRSVEPPRLLTTRQLRLVPIAEDLAAELLDVSATGGP